jgi:hypothetical protein
MFIENGNKKLEKFQFPCARRLAGKNLSVADDFVFSCAKGGVKHQRRFFGIGVKHQ